MLKPDWLVGLEEEDPDCKEGFYIGLPPNTDDLCDDEESEVKWSWDVIESGLLELIAWGPPPDIMKVSFMEALTSWPCVRIYVARQKGNNLRAAVVMDKLVSDVFSNIGNILKLPMAKKYINAWLRSYHPKLALVLNGEVREAAQGISLVWTRPSWAQRQHWVLTSLLDMPDGELTQERATAITQDTRFRKLRNAHRNLLNEDAEYLSLQGQIKGAGRAALEGLETLVNKLAEDAFNDALDELVNDYYDSAAKDRVRPLRTSFRKPDLFRRFEENLP